MKVAELKKLAERQMKVKGATNAPRDGKAVRILRYKSRTHLDQVGINVYSEGKTGLFSAAYWMAVYDDVGKKIYIIPASERYGYKVQVKKSGTGCRNIHFTNRDIGKTIDELGINNKGFDWKYDTECQQYFIALDNKHDKKMEKAAKTRQADYEAFWNEA